MKTTIGHSPGVRAAQPFRLGRALLPVLLLCCLVVPALPAAGEAPAPWTTTLRLQTPSYELTTDGVRVSGYRQDSTPGAPALPVWGTAVELPPEGDYEIAFESIGAVVLPVQAVVRAAAVPDLPRAGGPQPILSLLAQLDAVPAVDRPDGAIYGADAFYPASPVVDAGVQWQRGQRLLALRVFPFQYNPVAGTLRYHPDLRITVAVSGDQPSSPSEHPERSAAQSKDAFTANPPANTPGALRIRTAGRGMVGLTYEALAAAIPTLAAVDPATFEITYLGQPVAAHVTGDGDGEFEAGEHVIFYAQPYEGRYQTENVYWLTYGGAPGRRMATRSAEKTVVEPATTIRQTLHVEFDREYRSEYPRPRDADHWFDFPLTVDELTGVLVDSVDYDLAVDDALPGGDLLLRAALHGGADLPADPDKSVEIRLNSHVVGAYPWEGMTDYVAQATVPASWLDATPNRVTLEVALAQLADVGFYTVSPDWVEVTYPALADADGADSLYIEALAAPATRVAAAGFTTPDVMVYDLRDPSHPVRLLTTEAVPAGAGYTLHFWDDAALPDGAYFLSSAAALAAPQAIEQDTASSWATADHEIDYIAIMHASLAAAVEPLLVRRAQPLGGNLRVARVDVQDIYDEFSFGRLDPEAIRDFLRYAYRNWNGGGGAAVPPAPPQYVLLVGDGHYDYTGASGISPSYLPNLLTPYLVHVDPTMGETAADNRFASVDDPKNGVEDRLPDMAIGRIPARWPADVTAAVDKILAYEAAPAGDWQSRVVFLADDNADPAGRFHDLSDEVRTDWLPAGYDERTIYYLLDAVDGAAMRTAIKGAFNGVYAAETGKDAVLLQWFGHGSKFRWGGSTSMFNTYDPPALDANDVWPFTFSYSCLTGYFVNLFASNEGQSLAETLLQTPGLGSVADLSPSGWHNSDPLLVLNEAVTLAIFRDRIRPVGQAVGQALGDYFANSGGAYDVIDTSILFGDPALKLRVPATLPPPPAVDIAGAAGAATLSWPHSLDSSRYEVWRGTAPYFNPATAGLPVATVAAGFRGVGPGFEFTDDGTVPPPPVAVIGDPATNYFWVMRSRNGDGASDLSNRVGEFDFALTPGDG